MKTILSAVVLLFACSPVFAGERQLTYVDLVHRLTDLEHLAVLPEPGEGGAQCSSYDRASKYDAATDSYIKWDANGDGGGIIRMEGDQAVIAEMQGPGCIWRIWSAAPKQGHVRIYLDGAAEPTVDLPFKGYFDRTNEPFTRSTLVHTVTNGWNCYVPIPYQKSCKVMADKGWGNYYHFTYGSFPKDTIVPTFKRELSAEESAALDAADQAMSHVGTDPAPARAGATTDNKDVTVEGGQTAAVACLKGPAAITCLRVRIHPTPAEGDYETLRELALRITWDDQKEPAVWCPLGDFFGTAPGVNKYRSLPLGMTDDGFYSFWYMPFASGAKVELVNDGKTARQVSFEITHAPLSQPIQSLGRFHAKWHRDAFLPQREDRKVDWTMLIAQGRGRYCGVMLHIWNPRGGWWGEGDEKFFVDGEKFPSTFGTGSEDYFGYAWSDPHLFQHPLHNQTISQGNRGHISVNRWHIADNVPFQTSFEGCIEKYFPNKKPTLYALTAFWYLSPDGVDPYPAVPLDERIGYWTPPLPTFKVAGAIEAEKMKILSITGGNAGRQEMTGRTDQWSDEAQLWWTHAKVGDKLELALPVEKAGRYKLTLQLTKAVDYGIVKIGLDDKPLFESVDLYNAGVVQAKPLTSGTLDLAAGERHLQLEITGANPKAAKAYMVGIDYVKLEEAP